MQTYTSLHRLAKEATSSAAKYVTVGSFDGLHLGHQFTLNSLIQWARQNEGEATVITFRSHPRTLTKGIEVKRLLSNAQKLSIMNSMGIDSTLLIDFDESIRSLSAREFCSQILVDTLGAKGLLLGYNNRIGKDQEGTPEVLQAIGEELGLEVRCAPALSVNGSSVSSSAIRGLVEEGNFHMARSMLGRPYSIYGSVEKGRRLGRTLGFPTANLSLVEVVHPPFGVYGVIASLGSRRFVGAANIGVKPTVEEGLQAPLLEVHLLDFDEDCYGQEMDVEFVCRIRDEIRFESLEDLKRQIQSDMEEVTKHVRLERDSGQEQKR